MTTLVVSRFSVGVPTLLFALMSAQPLSPDQDL